MTKRVRSSDDRPYASSKPPCWTLPRSTGSWSGLGSQLSRTASTSWNRS